MLKGLLANTTTQCIMGFIGMQFHAQTTSIIGICILAFCLVDNSIDINFVFSILRNDDRYLAISGKRFAVHLLTHIRNLFLQSCTSGSAFIKANDYRQTNEYKQASQRQSKKQKHLFCILKNQWKTRNLLRLILSFPKRRTFFKVEERQDIRNSI